VGSATSIWVATGVVTGVPEGLPVGLTTAAGLCAGDHRVLGRALTTRAVHGCIPASV